MSCSAVLHLSFGLRILFGGSHLVVHLCSLFNCLLKHAYVPDNCCRGVIIPLLKSKHGDATRIDILSHQYCRNSLNLCYLVGMKNSSAVTIYNSDLRKTVALTMLCLLYTSQLNTMPNMEYTFSEPSQILVRHLIQYCIMYC